MSTGSTGLPAPRSGWVSRRSAILGRSEAFRRRTTSSIPSDRPSSSNSAAWAGIWACSSAGPMAATPRFSRVSWTSSSSLEPIHTIRLKAGEQDRLLAGHPWIYQNELEGWPPEAAPGDLVDLHDSQGRFLGRGYLNPRTTIAVRVLARDRVSVDQNFFLEKIRQAQALRERVMTERSAYRVVHGEADGLPGLVVDRYGDAVAIQLLTAGMDRRRDLILSAVEEVLRPHTIVARNDSTMREREGLSRERTVIRGQIQPEPTVTINRLDVAVVLPGGEKTRRFLVQVGNYPFIGRIAGGGGELGSVCYWGPWRPHAPR